MADDANFSMNEYCYIGAICLNSEWRFFYDSIRYMWALDFTNAGEHEFPERRQSIPIVDESNLEDWFATFHRELTPAEIVNAAYKPALTFVVNFDKRYFVDGDGESGVQLPLRHLIPETWDMRYNIRFPYYFVPDWVRRLWIGKYLIPNEERGVEEVCLHKWLHVGAVKFQGQYRFFYEHRQMWKLDFQSYMGANWLNNPIYGDWRKDLPYVDETNAESYFQYLEPFELSVDEIPLLAYVLSEQDLFLIEEGDMEPEKPPLYCLTDFDDKVFVQNPHWKDASKLNCDPAKYHAPEHWTCHYDNPLKYIPEEMVTLWQLGRTLGRQY